MANRKANVPLGFELPRVDECFWPVSAGGGQQGLLLQSPVIRSLIDRLPPWVVEPTTHG